jgi:hypothetical protein
MESLVLLFETERMEEAVELLLELIAERPVVGIAALALALSFICFIFTGSIVPIVCGFLISLWVRWRISRYRNITLGLGDTVPKGKH